MCSQHDDLLSVHNFAFELEHNLLFRVSFGHQDAPSCMNAPLCSEAEC